MPTISPEQKLEIARRVHETFDIPKRWHQGGWGRDDDGDVIEFDGGFHVVDNDEVRHRPAFRLATPESPRCFCLGAAIRIHTGTLLLGDPSHTGEASETMCAVYSLVHAAHDRSRPIAGWPGAVELRDGAEGLEATITVDDTPEGRAALEEVRAGRLPKGAGRTPTGL